MPQPQPMSVRARPGAEPGETRIGVDPRDRAPFVGLDLCISKGIGYVQGAVSEKTLLLGCRSSLGYRERRGKTRCSAG